MKMKEGIVMMWERKAQSTVEYAVLAAVVVGALLAMQIYVKRGVSGKLREATDRIGEQFTPETATYEVKKGYSGKRSETTTAAGAITSAIDASKAASERDTICPPCIFHPMPACSKNLVTC